MKRAVVLISGTYMERVEPRAIATGGVEGMLDRLAPRSSSISPQRARQTDATVQRARSLWPSSKQLDSVHSNSPAAASPYD